MSAIQFDGHAPALDDPKVREAALAIALRFSQRLSGDLKPVWPEVLSAHRSHRDPATCVSHDYCDANMVMEAAVTDLIADGALSAPVHIEVVNLAWAIARADDFGEPLRRVTLFGAEFTEWHSGGGCMSLKAELGDGRYALLTDTGGDQLPTRWDWMLGIYDEDGEPLVQPNLESTARLVERGVARKLSAVVSGI